MPWELTGNAGTNPTNDFLGTTDEQPLVIRTNDSERVRATADGNVAIGTSTPTFGAKLTVAGGGATVNGVAVGTDVDDIDYNFQYETVGVADSNMHLRLQSPNLIIFHTGDTLTPKMAITEAGSVGIGTDNPGENSI